MTVQAKSDWCNHDVGRGWCVKADGAAVDLDHALLALAFAEHLEFAAGQETKIGHPGTGPSITVDGADTETIVATGLGQRNP